MNGKKEGSLITEIIHERLEASDLANLLPSLDLILTLSQRELGYQKRASLLEKLYSENALIENPESRAVILSALKKQEAIDLLNFIKYPFCQKDPFAAIVQLNGKISKNTLAGICHFFGLELSTKTEEKKEIQPIGPVTEITPLHGLYSYQRDALNRIEELLEKNGSALLHMPTGSGKTRTAMAEVCLYLRRNVNGLVVWLADTYELCEQAAKEFIQSWKHQGDRTLQCYCFFDGMKSNIDKIRSGFVVMSLQQATRFYSSEILGEGSTLSELASHSPLIIFDEAHKAVAPKYKKALERLMPITRQATLIGLSATPGRSTFDSIENQKLVKLFSNKVALTVEGYDSPIDYLITQGYLSKPTFKPVNSEFDYSALRISGQLTSQKIKKIEEKIANDKERTLLILQEIRSLIKAGNKRILVFAASVDQAYRLAFVLNFFATSDEQFDYEAKALSASSVDRRETIKWYLEDDRKESQIRILCNFGILTTGFDAPRTSAVLIGRPTTSLVLYSQMVGRGLRGERSGGTATAEIVTIVDPTLPAAFRDVAKSFEHWDQDWKTANY